MAADTKHGILRCDLGKFRRGSSISVEFKEEPTSPQASGERLAVSFAHDEKKTEQVKFKTGPMTEDKENEAEDEEEEYSASVSAIMERENLRRRGSKRRGSSSVSGNSRRRSSVFTTSSLESGISMEDIPNQEEIFQNMRIHKEVISQIKYQPWPIRRKLRLVRQAKSYLKRHEGEIQERLARTRCTKDILSHMNIIFANHWSYMKRECANFVNYLIPWELRIKEIESHFGSVVASYFTFLRWLFFINLIISIILVVFLAVPKILLSNPSDPKNEWMKMLPDEKKKSMNLITLWNFEGVLKYSPLFYGYYIDRNVTHRNSKEILFDYKIPLAYFITELVVYIYSFVAILRKMAENSRQSKLSEKDDDCVFIWKIFTSWDFMIGNSETANNRTSSIILGFKEALLEEAEKKRDEGRDWKLISMRLFTHVNVVWLLASSMYAVVWVVHRSTEEAAQSGWWRQNEVTLVLSLIGMIYPVIFEGMSLMEKYHPRKALRLQLARIMVLNLLNLYTFIFATFSKINDMSQDLIKLKPNISNQLQSNLTTISRNGLSCVTKEIECKQMFNFSSSSSKWQAITLASLILSNYTTVPSVVTTSSSIFPQNLTLQDYNISFGNKMLNTNNTFFENISKTNEKSNYIKENKFTNYIKNFIVNYPYSLKHLVNLKSNELKENLSNPYQSNEESVNFGISIDEINFTTPNQMETYNEATDKLYLAENTTYLNVINENEEKQYGNEGKLYKNGSIDSSEFSEYVPEMATELQYENENVNYYNIRVERENTSYFNTVDNNVSYQEMLDRTTEFNYNFTDFSYVSPISSQNFTISDSTIEPMFENELTTVPIKISISDDNINTTLDSSTSVLQIQNVTTPPYLCYVKQCTDSKGVTTSDYFQKPMDSSRMASDHNSGGTPEPDVPRQDLSLHADKMDEKTKKKLRGLCWETMFGQELIKLTVMDLCLTITSILMVDFLRALFVRALNSCWCWNLEKRFPQYGDFKMAENLLHLVNNQGMVWMGMFFSPGLPLINLLKLAIIMYLRSWAVLTCNVPHEVVFRASRSNNFYFGLLLTMLFLCVLPVGYAMVWVEPSWHCGPFSNYSRIYHLFTHTLKKILPSVVHRGLDYIASPGTVIPLLILLILIIYYLVSLTNALREANDDLKIQLRRERTEERRKMYQLVSKKKKGVDGMDSPFNKWVNLLAMGKTSIENTHSQKTSAEGKTNGSWVANERKDSSILEKSVRKWSHTSEEGSLYRKKECSEKRKDEKRGKRTPLSGKNEDSRGRRDEERPKEEDIGQGQDRKESVASLWSLDNIPEIKISLSDSEEVSPGELTRASRSSSADTIIKVNDEDGNENNDKHDDVFFCENPEHTKTDNE